MDLGRISVEERTRRIKNQLCMYCGGEGHWRADCPAAANKGTDPGPRGRGGGRGGRGGGRGNGRGAHQQPQQDPNQYYAPYQQAAYPRGGRGGFSYPYPGHGYNQQVATHLRQFTTPVPSPPPSTYPLWTYATPVPQTPAPEFPPTGHVIGTLDENGASDQDQGNGAPSH
ncbi:MAG: hypothetical protein JWP34_4822 [Massilia sp.]|nr:hypothetical protein [Massilia sp.]